MSDVNQMGISGAFSNSRDEERDRKVREAFQLYKEDRNRDYEIVGQLNTKGAFSAIYEIKDGDGNSLIMKAVDTTILDIDIEPKRAVRYIDDEIEYMRECNECPYIVDLIDAADVIIDEKAYDHVFLIFMPKLLPVVDYFEQIGYEESEVIRMGKDLCRALSYIHQKDILHRDVKPGNIYYIPDDGGRFVLSDFGTARILKRESQFITVIGTWIAPEIAAHKDLEGRKNSDLYSLGKTMIQLLASNSPNEQVMADALKKIRTDLNEILMNMIEGDPSVRYQTAEELLQEFEKIESSRDVKLNVQICVDHFVKGEDKEAYQLAKQGCEDGNPVMRCIYAYLLNCVAKGKQDINQKQKLWGKAFDVLDELKDNDPVAKGIYGIIGWNKGMEADRKKDQNMLQMMHDSADEGFSVTQYLIGRYYMDGQNGFEQDRDKGMEYIIQSSNKGFLPALFFLYNQVINNEEDLAPYKYEMNFMRVKLNGFNEENFPAETIQAIANAY